MSRALSEDELAEMLAESELECLHLGVRLKESEAGRENAWEVARSILSDAAVLLPRGWADEWYTMFPELEEPKAK
jgi:hypothetical protein